MGSPISAHSTKARNTETDSEELITCTDNGQKVGLDVYIMSSKSAFGDVSISENRPVVQIDAIYGIKSYDTESFSSTGGAVTFKSDHQGKEFECSTGTSVGGYGLVRSSRSCRYRPGQGTIARFTARMDQGVANCRMAAGLVTSGNELSFGYYTGAAQNGTFDGTEFGILYRTGGRLEIRTLSITTPAGGAETLTITLNSVAYSVSVTAGTAAFNAFEIAGDSDFGSTKAWSAYQNDGTIVFVANSLGSLSGTYSVTSTGALVGSFAQTSQGYSALDNFYVQSEWNRNTLLTGSFVLDPSKGNVYQVQLQYLGYGSIKFFVENPINGEFVLVHDLQYANNNTIPSLDNPTFKVGWFAASLGSTTDLYVRGASAAMFNEGIRNAFTRPKAHGHTKTGVTTALTNIISIRNRASFAGFVNLADIYLESVTVAVDGTKPAVIELHINPTLGGTPNWTTHDADSIVEYDVSGTTVTGGNEIYGVAVGKSESIKVAFEFGQVWLNRGDVLAIAVKATTSTTDVTAYINWIED